MNLPTDRLTGLSAEFANPGKLGARTYVPEGIVPRAPLVVVLHGCTQDAAAYDQGSGWSQLADRTGFALLFPEQQRSNNPNLCFNWFSRKDTARGAGEAASIAAMIGATVAEHGLDPQRVFVTGLSAGGAMSAAMLEAYPELFAAGAIIAGLPAGIAEGVPEALSAMAGGGGRTVTARAAPHAGRLPRLSVWHGSADTTVSPSNGDAIVAQALAQRGIDPASGESQAVGRHRRTVWAGGADSGGTDRPQVEQFVVAGMGHGVPLSAAGTAGADAFALGRRGPHMLEAGIDSTARIAAFFGLVELADLGQAATRVSRPAAPRAAPRHDRKPAAKAPIQPGGVQAVIEDALRKAGLMR
jgi:poly(hydroxyalkanoate) depolymerase family esterase